MNLKRLAIQALRRLPNWISAERGAFSPDGKARLQWFPLQFGTLSGSIGRGIVHDDSNGCISCVYEGYTKYLGTINYLTGEMCLTAPVPMTYILGYLYAPELAPVQKYEMVLVSTPIRARVRKLRCL